MTDSMIDLLLKFITIGSVLLSGIAIYIGMRNNSRQIGAHIFLSYSDRIRSLRATLAEDNYPPHMLLETMYLIFEFYSLRRRGYVSNSIWDIWESDITRFLSTESVRRKWGVLKDRFVSHPHFVGWVNSMRAAEK